MNRKSIFKSLASIVVLAMIFSQVILARAAKIDLGGEAEDNFWNVDVLYCKDGFTVTASQYYLSDQGLPYWLELGDSSIPVTVQTAMDPYSRIAHGDGSALVNGTANFFFTELQTVGTPVDVTIERWDHGNMTYIEGDADETDHSHSDDRKHITEDDGITIPKAGDCLIDNVAPNITITSPQNQNYLQTATVPTTWNVTDNLSGVASDSGMVDSTPVTNGQIFDLFNLLPGPHTLTVNAADKSGNLTQASVNFNVVVTIDSLINTTKRVCTMGWISKNSVCKNLNEILIEARLALKHGNTSDTREKLREYVHKLNAQKGKSVSLTAYNLLTADAKYILGTLPPSKEDDHH